MKFPAGFRIAGLLTCVFAVTVASTPVLSAGKPVDLPARKARASTAKLPVTYTRDIAPILFHNCASCHHSGDIGPFSLTNFEDAKKRAQQIVAVTESRYMPPWRAQSHGEFAGERKLTTGQIETLRKWVEGGAPEGLPTDLPEVPAFPKEWALGTPDFVGEPAAAYNLEAEGQDVYRCFVVPTHFAEDRYISTMEIRPGNRAIVHHVVACLDTTGTARRLEKTSGGTGYTPKGSDINPSGAIGIWTPGNAPSSLPEGVGFLLPRGADIVLQVHYSKSGKPETDQTRIGMNFCKGAVDKQARVVLLFQPYLDIPAGDANYMLRAFPMPTTDDVTILQIMPHMHLLGRNMTVTAKLPDKTQKVLINIVDWSFRWQQTYTYKEPVKLPRNTVLTMTARYDNSSQNQSNPFYPPRRVKWGSLSTDEMCIAGIIYTSDSEHLTQGKSATGFYGFGRF